MSDALLIDEPLPGVQRWTLNRPDSLNAFNSELRERFRAATRSAVIDRSVRVVVVRGSGRAFSAGVDVVKRATGTGEPGYLGAPSAAADFENLADDTLDLFLDVWRAPFPVIAHVHGYCIGIANVLAACCDLVFAEEGTVLGWPGAPLGGGMIGAAWSHTMSPHLAKEMSYTVGARMSAEEAARLGMVNRVFSPTTAEAQVLDVAAHIARLGRELLRIKKSAINQVMNRQGFEETVRAAAAWDALAHEADIVHETREDIRSKGLKAVLADWRPPARDTR